MDGLRDFADDSTRWYSADAPSGRRSRRSRSEEHGYRVPEPRGSEATPARRGAGGERRRGHSEEDRFGDRYGTDQPAVVTDPEPSYPGFEVRTPMDAGLAAAPASPATYSGGTARSPLPEVTASGYAQVRTALPVEPETGGNGLRAVESQIGAVAPMPTPPVRPADAAAPSPPVRPADAARALEPTPSVDSTRQIEPVARTGQERGDGAPVRRSAGPPAAVGDGVYRTRRPGIAVLLAAAVLVLELPAVRLLLEGAMAATVVPAATVAGIFLVAGTPLLAFGLYAVMTSAGRVSAQPPAHAWFRPPAGYLAVGLVLFLAAALAV